MSISISRFLLWPLQLGCFFVGREMDIMPFSPKNVGGHCIYTFTTHCTGFMKNPKKSASSLSTGMLGECRQDAVQSKFTATWGWIGPWFVERWHDYGNITEETCVRNWRVWWKCNQKLSWEKVGRNDTSFLSPTLQFIPLETESAIATDFVPCCISGEDINPVSISMLCLSVL